MESWVADDAALCRRGNLTIWVKPEEITAWTPFAPGLRPTMAAQAEGLMCSLMRLLGLEFGTRRPP
ncbi:Transposase [Azospirillum largimobile]